MLACTVARHFSALSRDQFGQPLGSVARRLQQIFSISVDVILYSLVEDGKIM